MAKNIQIQYGANQGSTFVSVVCPKTVLIEQNTEIQESYLNQLKEILISATTDLKSSGTRRGARHIKYKVRKIVLKD